MSNKIQSYMKYLRQLRLQHEYLRQLELIEEDEVLSLLTVNQAVKGES